MVKSRALTIELCVVSRSSNCSRNSLINSSASFIIAPVMFALRDLDIVDDNVDDVRAKEVLDHQLLVVIALGVLDDSGPVERPRMRDAGADASLPEHLRVAGELDAAAAKLVGLREVVAYSHVRFRV